jgi:hypothetical protein
LRLAFGESHANAKRKQDFLIETTPMATDPGPKRQPSMATMILWVLFCFVMWYWAIVGPLFLVIGIMSLYGVDFIDFPGQTITEKLSYMEFGAVLSTVGLAFVWLRCRGYLKFGDRD